MIEYAVKRDGRWRILDAGPGTLIAFEDEFGQSMPDGPEGAHMWRHLLWIAHRELASDQEFGEWVQGVTDVTGDDDRIAEIHAELDASRDPPLAAIGGVNE